MRTTEDVLVLKELIEAGKVTPVIDRTYPLSEAPMAIRHLEGGHARLRHQTQAVPPPPAAPSEAPDGRVDQRAHDRKRRTEELRRRCLKFRPFLADGVSQKS